MFGEPLEKQQSLSQSIDRHSISPADPEAVI